MIGRLAAGAAGRIEGLLNEDRIGLAVTGLSRAGKTVFITSLVHNLLALGAAGRGRDTLPLFTAALRTPDGDNRLRGIRILPPDGGLPQFDYAGKLASLAADTPAWPEPTQSLAQISLAITLDRRSPVARFTGPRRVRLDILDYPGEWLLDLPLLQRDFARWSAETLALLRTKPRAEIAGRFLTWLGHLRAADPPDATTLAHGAGLYRASLRDAAARGLRYLQPGRFLAPPAADDPDFLTFFPLEGGGPTAALLAARFAGYQRDMRRRFFDTHFRRFDRQVMLVDLLSALHAGRAAFEDTARAISDIASGLRHGWGHGLKLDGLPLAHHIPPVLLGGRVVPRPIGRVAFVATKADHVPALRRENLRNLLRAIVARGTAAAGSAVSHHVAAAVLATEDATARIGDRPTEVVRGVLLGETQARAFHVGDVPSAIPPDGFWAESFFSLPVFRPPRIIADGSHGIPHLGLDAILTELIGDRL
ncbi:MAG TPA: YcjX family protein [Acetobacteraceae bacterium]|nr:YcjX family protein [Acetobacteraceae bacterium]